MIDCLKAGADKLEPGRMWTFLPQSQKLPSPAHVVFSAEPLYLVPMQVRGKRDSQQSAFGARGLVIQTRVPG